MRCLAYSPPGGLLSTEAATESEKFTLSLVLGDDVIPRTSLANIARLSRDIKGTATRDLIRLSTVLCHTDFFNYRLVVSLYKVGYR